MARSASRKKTKNQDTPAVSSEIQKRVITKKDGLPVLIVIGTGLILNLIGFGWGMDGHVPWAPDAIAVSSNRVS